MDSRAVLVTGSSRGVGRAVAALFAAGGDRVAVHCRDAVGLAEEVVSSLPGQGHTLVRGDLADPESTRALVETAAGDLGGLDVLVNNAAVFGDVDDAHPVLGTTYERWQQRWQETFAVNLFGAANACWAAAPHLRERSGRIVNVSSRGAYRGEPEQPAYGASKAALNAMGQSLAVALAPYGIGVVTVAPGFVETDMARGHLEGARGAAIRAQSPFGRVAQPEEVAAAVHWLASPGAEWASGAVLDLNGASHLR